MAKPLKIKKNKSLTTSINSRTTTIQPDTTVPAFTSVNLNAPSYRVISNLQKKRDALTQPHTGCPKQVTIKGNPIWLMSEWICDCLPRYREDPKVKAKSDESLQQIDLLREFYLEIAQNGLQSAYERWGPGKPVAPPQGTVLIVGAGMSGLVAAYELKRAGYKNVKILEMSQRFGGRVKTLSMKDGFDRGLHADAGAMRIPLPPKQDRPIAESHHFLTDYYAQKFNLKEVPFINYSENAFYHFYGDTIQIAVWNKNPKQMFTKYWPGWNAEPAARNFNTINEYASATVEIVVKLLKLRLKWAEGKTWLEQATAWSLWNQNWCQFTFGSFLRSTLEGIKSQLAFLPTENDKRREYDVILNQLEKYLPWPEEAITAYNVFNNSSVDDSTLSNVAESQAAKWFTNEMHSLEGGLSALPEAFAQQEVEDMIVYNRMVMKIEVVWKKERAVSVRVHGIITSTGQPFLEEGCSVLLTVPLNVLRGFEIVSVIDGSGNLPDASKFPEDFQKAIQNISYTSSTKIMLQYKEQFWHKDALGVIKGGSTTTDMPIGSLYYPTISEKKNLQELVEQKGILMSYTGRSDALLWGALTEDQAIMLVVNQINRIHPNSKHLFEVAQRQAWGSDPTTLGAFAALRPQEYISVLFLMLMSWNNMFFAGEAISFASGWIQGALGSGLRAAFQLYYCDQIYESWVVIS